MSDLVVVGGGPAGLTTALAAARRGRRVTLYESSDHLGGMAASIEIAGQRVDLGSHRLHPTAPPHVAALLDELLGGDLQTRERNGRLRLDGSWVRFPFRPADLLRSVPKGLAARLTLDLLRAGAADGDTYAEVVRSGLGRTALDRFHGPMAQKLWGRPPEELAGELARRRISVRDRSAVARRLARTSRPTGRMFRYPRLGYGQVVDRLADAATDAGVDIRTGVPYPPGADTHVVWTAPLASLADLLGGPEQRVEHRGVVLVYLVVEATRWTTFDAHYVPDLDVAFARLSEPKNYRDGPDPEGVTVLCAEVPAGVGDPTWQTTDDDLGALVLDGIGRCGLPVPDVDEVHTVRLPRVYPLLTADAAGHRQRMLDWADSLTGVTVVGRQGLLVADNLHHVIDMGLSLARCLGPSGGPDPQRWAAERHRFEHFVVDD